MQQPQAFVSVSCFPAQQAPVKQQQPLSAEMQRMFKLILGIYQPHEREASITALCSERDTFHNLGPALWYGEGIMAILLQEIVSVYPLLSTPHFLNKSTLNRVASALTLLQPVAYNESTRRMFLESQICLFLYPFLRVTNEGAETLRLTSLGVIGTFMKTGDATVIEYLLNTEIFPLCLNIMEFGAEFSRVLAAFIVQRLLYSEKGLKYVCLTPERFTAVATVLGKLVETKRCNPRLLRYVIRCYQRLSQDQHGCEALRCCLPQALRDATYRETLQNNMGMMGELLQLLVNIGDPGATRLQESLLASGKAQNEPSLGSSEAQNESPLASGKAQNEPPLGSSEAQKESCPVSKPNEGES